MEKKKFSSLHCVFHTILRKTTHMCSGRLVFASSVTHSAFHSGLPADIMCMCMCECVLSPPVSGEAQLVDFLNGGCLLHLAAATGGHARVACAPASPRPNCLSERPAKTTCWWLALCLGFQLSAASYRLNLSRFLFPDQYACT